MSPSTPIKRNFPSQAGMAKRAELMFRGHFPHFKTRLFEENLNDYVIVTQYAEKARQFFEDEFKKLWAPATLFLRLTDAPPTNFIQEIDVISMDRLHEGYEGFNFSIADIADLLSIEMPDLPLPIRSRNENNPIPLIFPRRLHDGQEAKVRAFLQKNLPDWPIEITYEDLPERSGKPKSDPFGRIRSSLVGDADLKFLRQDEAFWFDNLDAIFQGSQVNYLISSVQDCGASCYVDATNFDQIDLRQLILLYDTIYMSPPINDTGGNASSIWSSLCVSRKEFVHLIHAKRLKIIVTQPEERLERNLLIAAHEADSNSIVGRKTLAAIIASDIVRTADEFILLRPEFRELMPPLIDVIATQLKLPYDVVSKGLMWPEFARSVCLSPLMRAGAMGMASFSLGSVFAKEIESHTGQNLFIEATATTQGVHVAHALNATYIPPMKDLDGWNVIRNATADRLNFYRSFNGRVSATWIGNEERKKRREKIVPPLPLFQFGRYTKIEEILAVSSRASVTRKGRALVSRLAEIPTEERATEIQRLGQMAHDISARKHRRSLNIDVADNIIGVVDNLASIGIFPFKAAINIAQTIINVGRKSGKFDRMIDAIERDIPIKGKNEDLEFLEKTNRVAEIG